MRIVILLVALLVIAFGIVGLVSPDSVMAFRRQYVAATLIGPTVVGAVRVAIGLLLIFSAPASRLPKTLRVLGVLVCVQGLVQGVGSPFFGPDRAQMILEWEAAHPALLRVGAPIALATGGFIVFAVTNPATRSSS